MSGALTADLVMGLSGSGKSCLAATYAIYVWNRYKKVTNYYALDPGGVPSIVRKFVEIGIIRLWRVRTRDPDEGLDLAQGTLKRAVQGYWPTEFRDAATGEVGPGTTLAPPITITMELLCPNGHVVVSGTKDSHLNGAFSCKECRTNTSRANGSVNVKHYITPGFEDVGGCVFDGLTSSCEWVMSDLRRRGAEIDQGALKSPLKLSSDGMTFGANSEAHYGFAQNLAEDLLKSSANIPGLVAPPLWTANEKIAEDKSTRETLVGPEIAGKARTLAVPRWVGNLFGSVCLDVTTEDGTKKEWRLYLRQYISKLDGLPRACKTRFSPSRGVTLPAFLSDGPTSEFGLPENDAEPFTQFSLDTFYRLEEAALAQQLEQLGGYENVPKAPAKFGATPEALKKLTPVSTEAPPVVAASRVGKRKVRGVKPPPPAMKPPAQEAKTEEPVAEPVAEPPAATPAEELITVASVVSDTKDLIAAATVVPPAGTRPTKSQPPSAPGSATPSPKPPGTPAARPRRRRR